MKVKVTNRSGANIVYTVNMDNGQVIRRDFNVGETIEMDKAELQKLSYQPGGRELIMNYLLVQDQATVNEISNKVEPEYWMQEENIVRLLREGTMDEFLDCLDFAPEGVLDLIKRFSVTLPLNDIAKCEALMEKTGFDAQKAIAINKEANAPESDEVVEAPAEKRRRVEPQTTRRSTPNYKVVAKTE